MPAPRHSPPGKHRREGEAGCTASALCLRTGHAPIQIPSLPFSTPHLELELLLREDALERGARLGVHRRDDHRRELDHGDLGALFESGRARKFTPRCEVFSFCERYFMTAEQRVIKCSSMGRRASRITGCLLRGIRVRDSALSARTRRLHTDPSSSPMTPPPMTTMVFGTSAPRVGKQMGR